MIRTIFLLSLFVLLLIVPAYAADVDYSKAVTDLIDGPFKAFGVSYEIKNVTDTGSTGWKAVIVRIAIKNGHQPVAALVSADGKTVVFDNMVYVNKVPIFTKQMLPEFDKITIPFTRKDRRIYNPNGKTTLFMFFDPECSYCKQVEEKLRNYTGEYEIVLKNLPLHPNAMAEAVKLQAEWLRNNQHSDQNAAILRTEAQRIVNEDMIEAEKAGIPGTPFFVLEDGTVIQPNF